jgi:hypothetical protein
MATCRLPANACTGEAEDTGGAMPAPPCPQCGAATRFAGYDPWCPSCGWNREVAGERLRRASRSIPLYYLLSVTLFGLFFRVWKSPQPITLLFVFGMPLVPLGLLYASLRWSRSRFERDLREAAVGVRPSAASGATPPALPVNDDLRILREMPRPRPVRLSRKGKTNLAVAMTGVTGFAAIFILRAYTRYVVAGSLAALSGADWVWLGVAFLLAWTPYATWKNVQRHKVLMESGEVTLARVLRHIGNTSNPTIQYEFEDTSGQKVSGMASDMSRSIYEGMSVIVFFDAQDSRRRVAQCECFCEVVLRGSE